MTNFSFDELPTTIEIYRLILQFSQTDWPSLDSEYGDDINIDLDLSTEVHHSIMDILEELPNVQLDHIEDGDETWHRGYLQILVELITSPTSSVCTLTRVMKIIRAQTNLLLNCMIETPLLACLCIRLPYLLCSGNLEVSKSGSDSLIYDHILNLDIQHS